jgi:hypothetical protein
MAIMHDRSDLAATIAGLPFNELMAVSKEFVRMVADADRDITTPVGMAEMLADWAEAQDDND